MSAKLQGQRLVEVHGQRLTTTSLIVAELFGRKHSHVLKSLEKISTRIKIVPSEYRDSSGRANKVYILDERQFLIAMPFIGGKKSVEGQVRLVDEFLRLKKVLNEPGRKAEIAAKRDSASGMSDMLRFLRESDGKETLPRHYLNEHLFCNRALTGVWEPLDEADLDVYDTRLLAAIRLQNTLLMARYPRQSDRRALLDEFVADYRAKHPRPVLVGGGR
jgi:phage regulator Rha-like protein